MKAQTFEEIRSSFEKENISIIIKFVKDFSFEKSEHEKNLA